MVKLLIVRSERYPGTYSVVLADGQRVLATMIDGATKLAAQRTVKGQPRAWARASAAAASREAHARESESLGDAQDRARAARGARYIAGLFWPFDKARARAHLRRAAQLERTKRFANKRGTRHGQVGRPSAWDNPYGTNLPAPARAALRSALRPGSAGTVFSPTVFERLVASGYLRRDGRGYALTAAGRRYAVAEEARLERHWRSLPGATRA